MRLYIAYDGRYFVGWTAPPIEPDAGKKHKCVVPELYLERSGSNPKAIVDTLVSSNLLPSSVKLYLLMNEWAEVGMEAVFASKRAKRHPRPNPEKDGLFPANMVGKIERYGN